MTILGGLWQFSCFGIFKLHITLGFTTHHLLRLNCGRIFIILPVVLDLLFYPEVVACVNGTAIQKLKLIIEKHLKCKYRFDDFHYNFNFKRSSKNS